MTQTVRLRKHDPDCVYIYIYLFIAVYWYLTFPAFGATIRIARSGNHVRENGGRHLSTSDLRTWHIIVGPGYIDTVNRLIDEFIVRLTCRTWNSCSWRHGFTIGLIVMERTYVANYVAMYSFTCTLERNREIRAQSHAQGRFWKKVSCKVSWSAAETAT